MAVLKNPGAATNTVIGLTAAPTLTATATSSDDTVSPKMTHTTAATSGTATGVVSTTFTLVRAGWNVDFTAPRVVTQSSGTAGFRATVGLMSASIDTNDFTQGVAPATSFIGFQTNNPNTGGPSNFRWNWICITCDGLTVQRTYTTQFGIPDTFSGGTHDLRLVTGTFTHPTTGLPTTGVKFYINGIYLTTHFTSVPTGLLGYGVRMTNLNAAAQNIQWTSLFLEHDN